MLASTVAACGGGAGKSTGGASLGQTQSGTSAPASNAPPPKQVTIGVIQKVASIDPDRAIEVAPLIVNHLLYGTLTEYKPDASGIRPGLAASWKLSKDKRVLTFTLKPGEKFSDGTPLTAKDVAASFTRYKNDKANVNAGTMAPIDSITAVNDTTVAFKLASPYPSLPVLLAQPAFPVSPANRVNDPSFYKNPVTAGPYKLQSWGGGDTIVLARNDNYPGMRPLVPTIRFVTIPDANDRVAQLRSGQIDIASDLGPTLGSTLTGDVRPEFVKMFSGIYLYVNDRVKPLNDPRVRKAISFAADRQRINEVTFNGKSQVLGDLFPTTMKWSKPSIPTTRDVAKAKAMLKGTACEKGCTLQLMARNGREAYDQPGVVLKQNLQDIGITLNIEQVDNSIAGKREYDGNYQLEVGGLYDYADVPDGFLVYGVQSDGGIYALYSGYKNAEMDAAVKKAILSDGAARAAAVDKVHQIFARDMPYVPLVNYPLVIGTRLKSDAVFLAPSGFFEVARAKS